MPTDGSDIGPVLRCVAYQARPIEEQGILQHHSAIQYQFGSNDAGLVGIPVDGSAGSRAKLILLEDDIIDRVWETAILHPIEHHVAYSDLAIQDLVSALTVDDAGQPIDRIGVIVGILLRRPK